VKSALVTGGSSGIGLALARMLKEEGYALTLVARRPEKLAEAAEGLGAEHFAANLAEEEGCVGAVAAHAERWGGLDVLVNSAGLGIGGSFAGLDTKRIPACPSTVRRRLRSSPGRARSTARRPSTACARRHSARRSWRRR
jgi:NADP-dependent 3-hydroxy acid dehydrogenase YdfG